MTITGIITQTAEALPRSCRHDAPAIRQALNDAIDQAVRDGAMTELQANNWDQDRAVRLVKTALLTKD